jgi:hypothetical protein
MAATDSATPAPRPIFSLDPIQYVKLVSVNPDGSEHSHIVDRDAITSYSGLIRDLLNETFGSEKLSDDTPATSSSTLSDDEVTAVTQTIGSIPMLEFREIDKETMIVLIIFAMWKKRYSKVNDERIPDFPVPQDKNLALKALIAANELRV